MNLEKNNNSVEVPNENKEGMRENFNMAVELISKANETIRHYQNTMPGFSQEKQDYVNAQNISSIMASILIELANDFTNEIKITTLKDGDEKEVLLKAQESLQQLAVGAQKAIDEKETKNIIVAIDSVLGHSYIRTNEVGIKVKPNNPLENILQNLTSLKS